MLKVGRTGRNEGIERDCILFLDKPSTRSNHSIVNECKIRMRYVFIAMLKKSMKMFTSGPLFNHQSQLPKLPVPSLSETMTRYLDTVKPLVSQEQYERTKEVVANFQKAGAIGPILQQRLLERAEKSEKFLSF